MNQDDSILERYLAVISSERSLRHQRQEALAQKDNDAVQELTEKLIISQQLRLQLKSEGNQYIDEITGNLLREWRATRGFTQRYVVGHVEFRGGVSRLSKIENGRQHISIEELTRLVIYYKIPENENEKLRQLYTDENLSQEQMVKIFRLWNNTEEHLDYELLANHTARLEKHLSTLPKKTFSKPLRNFSLAVRTYLIDPSKKNQDVVYSLMKRLYRMISLHESSELPKQPIPKLEVKHHTQTPDSETLSNFDKNSKLVRRK